MQLRRVEARNFRAYQIAELDFEPSGLSVVIGPNNSGKTALLSALDMVGGQPVDGPLRFAGSAARPEVQALFDFDADERRLLAATVTETHRAEAEAAYRGAVFTFGDVQDNLPRLGVLRIAVLRSDRHQWPVAELILTPGVVGHGTARSVDWGTWLQAWEDKPDMPPGGTTGNVNRFFEQDQGPSTLPSMLVRWRSGFYHFRSLRPGAAGRKTSTENHDSLQPTGANLGNYLQWLRGHREEEWEKIRETIQELIPEIGRLQIPAVANEAEVGFETPGLGFVNIKDAGTGVEQLLLTVAVGQTTAASMLLVEDPETNLHPGAQRQLMRHVVDWSRRRPIVIATHSTIVMDAALKGRLYEVSRTGISSTVRPIEERADLADLLSRLGTRFSDLLGSERVLIVEGRADALILEAWFPELEVHSAVSVVPGGGGAGVWHMRLMEDMSTAADHLPRPILYIRDRDELSDRNLERLARLSAVRVLARRELENYLLYPAAIATVLAERRPEAPRSSPEDIASDIRGAADALRHRVVTSRVLENAECLSHLIPVTSDERQALLRVDDPVGSLLTLAGGKLEARQQSLEQCVREAFTRETGWVTERWPTGWEALVPGADVLSAIFAAVGGYSKEIDGPAVARAIGEPPEEIASIIRPFLAD